MDIDFAFVTRLLQDGFEGYRVAREKRITDEMLKGPAIEAWKLIREHEAKHGKLPELALLGRKMGIEVTTVPDVSNTTLPEIIEGLTTRYLHERLSKLHLKVGGVLEGYKPVDARALLMQELRALDDEGIGVDDSVVDVASLGEAVIARYEQVKAGKIGIPTPWAALDSVTLGWNPEDLAVFVARLGMGKTWTLMFCARAAWKAGYKVMLVTTEMAQLSVATRFFAQHFGVSYQNLRKARLGFEEEKFFKNVRAFDSQRRLLVTGGSFTVDTNSVELLVERERPDLLLIDGIYLMRDPYGPANADRSTRVGNNIEWLKSLVKRKKMAAIASTQFNRKVSENKEDSADVSKIGLSDLVGWSSDYVLALIQTPSMRSNRLMKLKTLKVREDTRITMLMNWDFEMMDFSEREVEREGDDEDEDDVPEQAKKQDANF